MQTRDAFGRPFFVPRGAQAACGGQWTPYAGGKAAQRTQGCGYRKGKGVPQQASGHAHAGHARRDGHAGGHGQGLGASVTRRPSSMVMKRLLTCWRKSQSWEMVMRAVGSAARMSKQALPGRHVQRIGGLVQQEGLWLHGQHSRQGDEFFLAAGKRMRLPVRKAVESEPDKGLQRPFAGGVRAESQIERPKGHIFQYGGEKRADPRHAGARSPPHSARMEIGVVAQQLALKAHAAARGLVQARDAAQQGGLAAAVGPVQADMLTGMQAKAHVPQHGLRAAFMVSVRSSRQKRGALPFIETPAGKGRSEPRP